MMWTDASLLQLKAVTRHAKTGWEGFRATLLGAAHALGAEVAANRLAYYEARQALTKAIWDAGHIPNADDRTWISQGLCDGTRGAVDPREDLGRLARDLWAEDWAFAEWEDLGRDVKERFMQLGKAVYDAGFQAGADSVEVKP
jgi:hypothetical protein